MNRKFGCIQNGMPIKRTDGVSKHTRAIKRSQAKELLIQWDVLKRSASRYCPAKVVV